MYSPNKGNITHVKTKVNQYMMRHEMSTSLSGSQIPFDASSSGLALDARSIGTSRIALDGSAIARNIGRRRKAGADRRGRKWRRRRRTTVQMIRRARSANTSDAAEEAMSTVLALGGGLDSSCVGGRLGRYWAHCVLLRVMWEYIELPRDTGSKVAETQEAYRDVWLELVAFVAA